MESSAREFFNKSAGLCLHFRFTSCFIGCSLSRRTGLFKRDDLTRYGLLLLERLASDLSTGDDGCKTGRAFGALFGVLQRGGRSPGSRALGYFEQFSDRTDSW